MGELKKKLVGDRRRVNSVPEVYVTIEDMELKDGGSIKFSPEKFTFNGLNFQTLVTVSGTAAELAGIAAAKGAAKLGLPEKVSAAGLKAGEKVNAAVANVAKMAGKAPRDERSFRIGVTVDMTKEFGEEKVQVKVKDFTTEVSVFNKVLHNDRAREFVEEALSQKASEVASRMGKKKMDALQSKIPFGMGNA
eukprot:CAMPEP_0172899650 /NCGR_PEP_ID=MMETSP1075-20121228/162338_1 /TAXON_ID=2916 /ORGANISM="Ceratium fusus, Strain PA161109" /LENGTH=191 /DNA_ID=CAMNT_0013755689 /DNA_START=35 /DNA_END=610 /DNA_ORIENTATION=-